VEDSLTDKIKNICPTLFSSLTQLKLEVLEESIWLKSHTSGFRTVSHLDVSEPVTNFTEPCDALVSNGPLPIDEQNLTTSFHPSPTLSESLFVPDLPLSSPSSPAMNDRILSGCSRFTHTFF